MLRSRNISRSQALSTLDQVCREPASGGSTERFLKQDAVRSRIRRAKESTGIRSYLPSPLAGEGGEIEHSEIEPGEGLFPRRTPHRALRATFSRNERRKEEVACGNQFVFATRGGIACVTNWVASSIASPSGVGITMRNGTRMRVPRTGANAISMLRAAARYLITGRSGM